MCCYTLLPFVGRTEVIVYQEKVTMDSYLFGNPVPVVNMKRIYPYFKFDAYSSKAV